MTDLRSIASLVEAGDYAAAAARFNEYDPGPLRDELLAGVLKLAFSHGFDAGLAKAQEIVRERV